MPIESAQYEETRQILMKDQHIIEMAAEMMRHPENWTWDELVHESGTPKNIFMMAALEEYRARAGGDAQHSHIGGPAEAIIRILKDN